jgi:DNA polymerase I-like protein with 3'-5' exonuclease and polymerase domains
MLLSVDYSQIEVRVLAYASGDKNLRRVFQTDDAVDVYVELASQIYEAEAHVITDEQRKHAKVALLSTMYGVGGKEMGRKLMVSTKAATVLRDRVSIE